MTIEYRRMRTGEEPAVLNLWSEVFATPAPGYQAARFATDPDAHAHTFVAVAPDGTILAALHYRVAFRCDAVGTPRPVGELDSVATRADARRQGHAARLILLALDAFRDAGCDWALLVASGEAGRRLYERYGWRCCRRSGTRRYPCSPPSRLKPGGAASPCPAGSFSPGNHRSTPRWIGCSARRCTPVRIVTN